MRTLRQLAVLTLKRLYGGQLRPSDQKVTEMQAMYHLLQARDFFMDREISRNDRDGNQYDETWFTRYEDQDVKWSESRGMPYVVLPEGYVDTRYDQGVRVLPMQGYQNPFIRVNSGFLNSSPELTFMEGNIPWQVAPATSDGQRKVEFPTMPKDEYTKVMLEVITRSGNPDPDKTLNMPAHYEDICIRHTLELLGYKTQSDETNDDQDKL